MSKQYEHIDSELASWLAQQRVFFVATAPLSRDGHINVSPKTGSRSTFSVHWSQLRSPELLLALQPSLS